MHKPRILIVSPSRHESGLGLFYSRAFRFHGCPTEMLGVLPFRPTENMAIRLKYRIQRMRPFGSLYLRNMFEKLLHSARIFAPDVIFVIRCEFLDYAMVSELAGLVEGRVFNIYPDSPIVLPGLGELSRLDGIAAYAAILPFAEYLIPVFQQLGAKQAQWLPFGFDPEIHFPWRSSSNPLDIAYFGSWGPLQAKWVRQLTSYDLAIYGAGWQRLVPGDPLRKHWRRGEGQFGSMAEKIANVGIVFNMVRAEHGCAHSMKTFEIPAAGGFMLSNWSSEQVRILRPGIECDYYSSTMELAEKLDFYLKRPEVRHRIAEAARQRIAGHSYYHRAEQLLGYLETGTLNIPL